MILISKGRVLESFKQKKSDLNLSRELVVIVQRILLDYDSGTGRLQHLREGPIIQVQL